MTQRPISIDPEHYLQGPLGKGEGPDPFPAAEWEKAVPQPDWGDMEPPPSEPQIAMNHGEVLSSLALIYLRHGDPARAMVLSLAAMSMGDLTPSTILIVAESMLRAGDPEQALAVLTRFERGSDQPGALIKQPTPAEHAARHYIIARVLYRRGDNEGARAALARSRAAYPPQGSAA